MEDMDDTLVISEQELEEMAVSRTSTRRRRSTSVGLKPLTSIHDLPPGTELYGPKGQRGYIAGFSKDGLVTFDLKGEQGGYITVECQPDAFCGWMTSGGSML